MTNALEAAKQFFSGGVEGTAQTGGLALDLMQYLSPQHTAEVALGLAPMLSGYSENANNAVAPYLSEQPTDMTGKFSRNIGNFVLGDLATLGAGKAIGLGKTLRYADEAIPALGAALGYTTAQEVAPDSAMTQLASALVGASSLGAVTDPSLYKRLGTEAGQIGSLDNLPMDEASRLARAKEMGFDTNQVYYHGSPYAEDIRKKGFDPLTTGKGNDQLGSGFYFTNKPEEAMQYAGDSKNTIETFLKVKNPIKIKGSNLNDSDVKLTLKQAQDIIMKSPKLYDPDDSPLWNWLEDINKVTPRKIKEVAENYTGHSLMSLENDFFREDPTAFRQALYEVLKKDGVEQTFENGHKHLVAWFPNQIRDTKAKFDPSKASSADLLAGLAGLTYGATTAQNYMSEE